MPTGTVLADVRAVNPYTGVIAAAAVPGGSGGYVLSVPPGTYVVIGAVSAGQTPAPQYSASSVLRVSAGRRVVVHTSTLIARPAHPIVYRRSGGRPRAKRAWNRLSVGSAVAVGDVPGWLLVPRYCAKWQACAHVVFQGNDLVSGFNSDPGFNGVHPELSQWLEALILNACSRGLVFVETSSAYLTFVQQEQQLSARGLLKTPFHWRPIVPQYLLGTIERVDDDPMSVLGPHVSATTGVFDLTGVGVGVGNPNLPFWNYWDAVTSVDEGTVVHALEQDAAEVAASACGLLAAPPNS